ncbi:hypothetical protein [Clostridium tertium]|uniref:hypothetical protein n=1 Tax=Clostridium tertium TaxID=1559 RepID=UPI0023B26D86|nr:hypothetical protein [Clostridium tertium]
MGDVLQKVESGLSAYGLTEQQIAYCRVFTRDQFIGEYGVQSAKSLDVDLNEYCICLYSESKELYFVAPFSNEDDYMDACRYIAETVYDS